MISLLIVPKYFNYYKIIRNSLLKNNIEVTVIIDDSGLEYESKKIVNKKFDYLLVIRGEYFDESLFKDFIFNRKVLYEWDSVKNFNYLNKIQYFNKVITFDRADAEKYKLQYLPLFYSEIIKRKEKKYDLLFVGIYHSDRIEVINKIEKQIQNKVSYKFCI